MDYNSVLNFGKYKGSSVHRLLRVDPKYLLWAQQKGASALAPHVLQEVLELAAEQVDSDYRDNLSSGDNDDWGDRG